MIRLVLPYPVSANRYWRVFGGRVVHSAEARSYRNVVQIKARGVTPLEGPVSVHVALCPEMTAKGVASKTRLDLDNCLRWRSMHCKASHLAMISRLLSCLRNR